MSLAEERAIQAQKTNARNAVTYALRTGKLQRPDQCARCGAVPSSRDRQGNPRIHAVHTNGHDWANRLNIEWLCVSCRARFVYVRKNK
jgi:hypothetical protein